MCVCACCQTIFAMVYFGSQCLASLNVLATAWLCAYCCAPRIIVMPTTTSALSTHVRDLLAVCNQSGTDAHLKVEGLADGASGTFSGRRPCSG